MMCGAR